MKGKEREVHEEEGNRERKEREETRKAAGLERERDDGSEDGSKSKGEEE